MPIEIKELHIKVTVQDTAQNNTASNNAAINETDREQLIAECLEKVLEVLALQKER